MGFERNEVATDDDPKRTRLGGEDWFAGLGDSTFYGVVAGGAIVLAGLVLYLRFSFEVTLPTKPPRPKMSVADISATARRMAEGRQAYESNLAKDSRRFTVRPATTVADMEKHFPHHTDDSFHLLDPKGGDEATVVTAGLKLTASVERPDGARHKQLVLTIENVSDKPLAYRVETRPSKGVKPCKKKHTLVHNAIAVLPGKSQKRTECIYRSNWKLEVTSVQTLEITKLSYYYVSELDPESVLLDRRSTTGHKTASLTKPCRVFLSSGARRKMNDGELGWRDVIDYFARHPCATYKSFPGSYRAWDKDGVAELPIRK